MQEPFGARSSTQCGPAMPKVVPVFLAFSGMAFIVVGNSRSEKRK
jgi:hypothetical protein